MNAKVHYLAESGMGRVKAGLHEGQLQPEQRTQPLLYWLRASISPRVPVVVVFVRDWCGEEKKSFNRSIKPDEQRLSLSMCKQTTPVLPEQIVYPE